MRHTFKLLIGASALFIAGCAAFFSVKGLGLLFAGSAAAVMVMAASLELGKLVAASFLYRYWRQISIWMRCYLTAAVVLLVGITSLGIYGYLARAYETTHTKVTALEADIAMIEAQIADTQTRIDATRARLGKADDAGRDDVATQQARIAAIKASLGEALDRLDARRAAAATKRDKDLAIEDQRRTSLEQAFASAVAGHRQALDDLASRVAVLDRAVDAYTSEGGSGFLKADKIKKGQELRDSQKDERDAIAALQAEQQTAIAALTEEHQTALAKVDAGLEAVQSDYKAQLATLADEESSLRVSNTEERVAAEAQLASLRDNTQAATGDTAQQIEAMYQSIRSGRSQIAALNEEINATDIGSYRFVARAFGAPVDDVVKWLILIVVLVFDPLAVVLTIGFNVALTRDLRPRPRNGSAPGSGEAAAANLPAGAALGTPSPAVVGLIVVALLAGLGVGGYFAYGHWTAREAHAHAQLIPPQSFAVATVRPALLQQQDLQGTPIGGLTTLLPPGFGDNLDQLAQSGFDLDRDLYLFVKQPSADTAQPAQRPVLLVGLIASVSDHDAAEAGLARFAESVAGVLLPQRPGGLSISRSRSMVEFGQGRYLDPEGGFFTYALRDGTAMLMLELEGDPLAPVVEDEARAWLMERDGQAGKAATLAARATPSEGAVTLWFDGRACFEAMPKTAADQAGYEQLRRLVDMDLVLRITSPSTGKLNIAGDYIYALDRFDDQAPATAPALPADAGLAGQLMLRCAAVMDYEAMIERLRETLGSHDHGQGAYVVVEKSIDTDRQASFELSATFPDGVQSPITDSLARLLP